MKHYCLSHLTDETLLRDFHALISKDRITTAQLLAHLAEVDGRKLYAPAGYPSMYEYCIQELRLSEDAAYKRIQAARAARQFPALFTAVADGRLHLTGAGLLAPHLTPENAVALLDAASGGSKSEIQEMLARRFPRSEELPMLEVVSTPCVHRQLAPAQVEQGDRASGEISAERSAAVPAQADLQHSGVLPLAPGRYAFRLSMDTAMYEDLCYAQSLLGHRIPEGDLVQVIGHALKLAIRLLEKGKFGATERPGRSQRRSPSSRHVPAHVRRAVWERDQGQCTFVSGSGRRCVSRRLLEFDHVNPVARGGDATTENLRLRCRTHNQYAAESDFGHEFMRRKRQEARERAAAAARRAHARERTEEVVPYLRALGFSTQEARQRAELCEAKPDASLEERVKLALSYISPRVSSSSRSALTPATGP